jgi:hypothetical protein
MHEQEISPWLNLSFLRWVALVISMMLNGCTGLPPLMIAGDPSADAPNGPQVAALVAHLKCETWDAVNSTQVLPLYDDSPQLNRINLIQGATPESPAYRRAFTLQNLFKEIEYVGEATWTLDVIQTGAVSPTTSTSRYFNGPRGILTATGSTLSVGGNLSEGAHRYLTFNSSIDFARLNATETAPFEGIGPTVPPLKDDNRRSLCGMSQGVELDGNLGIKENLATALIASAMNDISALQPSTPSPGTTPGGIALGPIPVPSTYSFGQISTQIDFTIIEGVSGGPLWSLAYFKGPGLSLFNFSRQVKDTLILTFVPVCIHQKYWTNSKAPPYEYSPPVIEGTPPWAKLLPPCGGVGYEQARINATATAQSRNDLILLQNSIRGF